MTETDANIVINLIFGLSVNCNFFHKMKIQNKWRFDERQKYDKEIGTRNWLSHYLNTK